MNEREVEFGKALSRLREEKGISIDEMAGAIKVRSVFLRALEEGRFEGLPPAIFLEGFVKAYAIQVGAPPDPLIARFRDLSAARRQREAPSEPSLPEARSGHRSWGRGLFWTVLVAAALAAGFVALTRIEGNGSASDAKSSLPSLRKHPPRKASESAPAPTAPAPAPEAATPSPEGGGAVPEAVTAPAVAPAETMPAAAAPPSDEARGVPAPETQPVAGDLVVAASGPCWCEIWADGSRAVYRQLAAGDRFGLRGGRFTVTLGNAGAIRMTFRGARVSLPSGEGAVVKGLELSDPKGAATP